MCGSVVLHRLNRNRKPVGCRRMRTAAGRVCVQTRARARARHRDAAVCATPSGGELGMGDWGRPRGPDPIPAFNIIKRFNTKCTSIFLIIISKNLCCDRCRKVFSVPCSPACINVQVLHAALLKHKPVKEENGHHTTNYTISSVSRSREFSQLWGFLGSHREKKNWGIPYYNHGEFCPK